MPSIAEVERLTAERRKATARNARDTAVLARGTDVIKAVAYYQRATRLDPSDPEIWVEYARAALDAGRTGEAKVTFDQAALKAQEIWAGREGQHGQAPTASVWQPTGTGGP